MKKISVKELVYAAVLLAVGMVLPFLTGQIPAIGKVISPLHYPIFLAGFMLSPVTACILGFVLPLLRSLVFGMPPIYPTALAMAFELAAYGLFAALLYRMLPKKPWSIYLSLIGSMLGGRIVWGLVSMVLYGVGGQSFGMEAFLAGAFITAWPGILIQLIIVPLLVMALSRIGLVKTEPQKAAN